MLTAWIWSAPLLLHPTLLPCLPAHLSFHAFTDGLFDEWHLLLLLCGMLWRARPPPSGLCAILPRSRSTSRSPSLSANALLLLFCHVDKGASRWPCASFVTCCVFKTSCGKACERQKTTVDCRVKMHCIPPAFRTSRASATFPRHARVVPLTVHKHTACQRPHQKRSIGGDVVPRAISCHAPTFVLFRLPPVNRQVAFRPMRRHSFLPISNCLSMFAMVQPVLLRAFFFVTASTHLLFWPSNVVQSFLHPTSSLVEFWCLSVHDSVVFLRSKTWICSNNTPFPHTRVSPFSSNGHPRLHQKHHLRILFTDPSHVHSKLVFKWQSVSLWPLDAKIPNLENNCSCKPSHLSPCLHFTHLLPPCLLLLSLSLPFHRPHTLHPWRAWPWWKIPPQPPLYSPPRKWERDWFFLARCCSKFNLSVGVIANGLPCTLSQRLTPSAASSSHRSSCTEQLEYHWIETWSVFSKWCRSARTRMTLTRPICRKRIPGRRWIIAGIKLAEVARIPRLVPKMWLNLLQHQ